MAEFPYIDVYPDDKLLAALIAKVKADEECEAICLVSGGAHGYLMRYQIVQFRNNPQRESFLMEGWSDISNVEQKSTHYVQQMQLNLVQELQNLRRENEQMRTLTPFDNQKGRYATIFLAVEDDGDWIKTQTPLIGQVLQPTAINRIFAAIFSN